MERKGGAVAAEVQVHLEVALQAEAGLEIDTRAEERKRAVRAQQKKGNQQKKRGAVKAKVGVTGIGHCLGRLNAAVGRRPSSVKGMIEIPKRKGTAAGVKAVTGAEAGHVLDLGIEIGKRESAK